MRLYHLSNCCIHNIEKYPEIRKLILEIYTITKGSIEMGSNENELCQVAYKGIRKLIKNI
jgi:hypothetical protein|tara:strand:- start:1195 stop:1374 length:180 start_codon:yes stop_codon:yes gene_type:complete